MKKILIILLCIPLFSIGQRKILPSPTPINQVPTKMCLSFSISTIYTILYNKDHDNFPINKENQINNYRISPTFNYYLNKTESKDSRKSCGMGMNPHNPQVWLILEEIGTPFQVDVEEDYFFPFGENIICNYYPYDRDHLINDIKTGSKYRIRKSGAKCGEKQYQYIDGGDFYVNIDNVKKELDKGRPCFMGGCYVCPTLTESGYSILENCAPGIFSSQCFGHAMVIIGYADNEYGGSFLIQDSYLKESNQDLKKGRHWVRYQDLDTIQDGVLFSLEGVIVNEELSYEDIDKYLKEYYPDINKYKDEISKEPSEHFDILSLLSLWRNKCESTYYSYDICDCIINKIKLENYDKLYWFVKNNKSNKHDFDTLINYMFKDKDRSLIVKECIKDTIVVGCVWGDCKDGLGKRVWREKSYQGNWKAGKYHTYKDKATLISKDGSQYIGHFKDGKKHGDGTLTLKNGNIWEGKWKNNMKHGKFFFTKNGIKKEKKFKNNQRK